jgi:hypothetical protein
MTGSKRDLINYRLSRAKDTLDDAIILVSGKQVFNLKRILMEFENYNQY